MITRGRAFRSLPSLAVIFGNMGYNVGRLCHGGIGDRPGRLGLSKRCQVMAVRFFD